MTRVPTAPGALNVTPVGNELVEIAGVGPATQQCTVAQLAGGGSQQHGTVTLDGDTPVAVANTLVTANSVIIFTVRTPAGTVSPNAPNALTTTPGTGFTVAGSALDTSVYNYVIIG